MRKERGLERLELAVSGKISQNEANESPPAFLFLRTYVVKSKLYM